MVKNSPAKTGDTVDMGSVPMLRSSSGKGMATHSSTLAWKIPRTEEPVGLQSMGSQRVGHDWVASLVQHWEFACHFQVRKERCAEPQDRMGFVWHQPSSHSGLSSHGRNELMTGSVTALNEKGKFPGTHNTWNTALYGFSSPLRQSLDWDTTPSHSCLITRCKMQLFKHFKIIPHMPLVPDC